MHMMYMLSELECNDASRNLSRAMRLMSLALLEPTVTVRRFLGVGPFALRFALEHFSPFFIKSHVLLVHLDRRGG